jgi:hypothetical protein
MAPNDDTNPGDTPKPVIPRPEGGTGPFSPRPPERQDGPINIRDGGTEVIKCPGDHYINSGTGSSSEQVGLPSLPSSDKPGKIKELTAKATQNALTEAKGQASTVEGQVNCSPCKKVLVINLSDPVVTETTLSDLLKGAIDLHHLPELGEKIEVKVDWSAWWICLADISPGAGDASEPTVESLPFGMTHKSSCPTIVKRDIVAPSPLEIDPFDGPDPNDPTDTIHYDLKQAEDLKIPPTLQGALDSAWLAIAEALKDWPKCPSECAKASKVSVALHVDEKKNEVPQPNPSHCTYTVKVHWAVARRCGPG